MTTKDFEKRIKEVEKWARDDAKHYWLNKHQYGKNTESIDEYFQRTSAWTLNTDKLIKQFNYTKAQVEAVLSFYNEAFWNGYRKTQDKVLKYEEAIKQYQKDFDEAIEIGKKVDVRGLDGFPCGMAFVYLTGEQQKSPLGKAIGFFRQGYGDKTFRYELPLNKAFVACGQGMTAYVRIAEEMRDFLASKGHSVAVYSMVD